MININEYLLGKSVNRRLKTNVDIQEIKDFFNSMLKKTNSDIINDTIDTFDKKYHEYFVIVMDFVNECVENGFEYSDWPGFGNRHYTETTKTIELSVYRNDMLALMFIDMAENICVECTFKRNNVQILKGEPDDDLYGYFDDDELQCLSSSIIFNSRKDSINDFYDTLIKISYKQQ